MIPTPIRGGQFSPSDLQQRDEIQALLLQGKFDQAEPLVRACIRHFPDDIYFLGQFEMILNGQGKYYEADELHGRIRKLWEKNYRAEWIARGSPAAESLSLRVIVPFNEYQVFGTEYFIPKLLEGANLKDPIALIAYYKVIVLPKRQGVPPRVFELDKAAIEQGYFLEEYSGNAITLVKTYTNEMPDIRTTVRETISYLDNERKGFKSHPKK